jgi:ribosomal protein L40E
VALTKRCPKCGASNPETAEWCSLCLERFEAPAPPELPEPSAGTQIEAPVAPPGQATPDAGAPAAPEKLVPPRSSGAAAAAAITGEPGAFEVTEEGIRWVCRVCGTPNGIEVQVCEVCGATFADHVRPKAERPTRDPSTAALVSLFFPGAGHAYVGLWGQAVARAVLSLWVLLVVIVGILDKDVPGSLVMATIFGIAALGLWMIAAHDAFREASNDTGRVLLRGKRFLYVVLGLMALLFVAMFIALLSARGRTDDAFSIGSWPSTSYPTSMEHPTD